LQKKPVEVFLCIQRHDSIALVKYKKKMTLWSWPRWIFQVKTSNWC